MRVILSLLLFCGMAVAQPDVKLTRDPNPNPDYVSYIDWVNQHPETGTLRGGPTVVRPAPVSRLEADNGGLVCLVVEQGLEAKLTLVIGRWIEDLELRGYTVELSTYSTAGTVEDLKEYLVEKRTYGLSGAVLLGSLPVAWFQMNDDWDGEGDYDYGEDWYEEFPCDLYLTDLDGVWSDDSVRTGEGPLSKGQDGMYDTHAGSKDAEIWVSRIDASRINYRSAEENYRHYFARVDDYKQAELVLPSKGLFYIDQDWHQGFTEEDMDLVVEEYEEIRDTMITDADDYKDRFVEDGLYLTVCVHSDPACHFFHRANDIFPSEVMNWEINNLEPQYGFYNLFACSNCRWVETNCMGSLYSFTGNGLASLGTTKTGSMLYFSEFNTPLSQGESWGEAFKKWTNYWISTLGAESWARSWFMGMTILGDGTLHLGEQEPAEVAVTEVHALGDLSLRVDPLIDAAFTVYLSVPRAEYVRLEVYDASGRLINTLHHGVLNAGQHSLKYDNLDWSRGVYFIRLTAPGTSVSRKVTFLR